MNDQRVHPTNFPLSANDNESLEMSNRMAIAESESYLVKPRPPPGSYIIQVPKDQIYRVPPPENAKLLQSYRRRGARARRCSSPCCRCLLWSLAFLLAVLLALAVTTAVLYLVFNPKLPTYTLDAISIKGFNVSLTGNPVFYPELEVTVRADNPNKKIGIHYRDGSDLSVSYSNVHLCSGEWPVFDQGARNVTLFRTALKGSGIKLSPELRKGLKQQEEQGKVPLEIDANVPVRVKFGLVTTWTMKVKVRCDLVVDKLTTGSRIVSTSCRAKL